MPARSKVPLADILAAFHQDVTLKKVARQFGMSPNTLRDLWKAEFGEPAFETRSKKFRKGAPEGAREEAILAFSTEDNFKDVAKRLGMSPNTLRVVWVTGFGEAAFEARSQRMQQRGATAFGRRTLGVAKKLTFVDTVCSTCGAKIRVSRLQRSVSEQVLCETCRHPDRTVPCPVCGLLFEGRGLPFHVWRATDEAHQNHVRGLREARWQGLIENQDYVVCRVCEFKAEALNGHLRTHDLTAAKYVEQYPDALIRSVALTARRSTLAVQFRHDLNQGDLLPHVDAEGRVVVAAAANALKCASSTVLAYCRKFNIPTRNNLAWQKIVLDQAKEYLGSDYVWEWTDPRIISPESGHVLNFDGFFPAHNLILEAHGDQHFYYSEKWHGSSEGFQKYQERDVYKRHRAEELGFKIKVIRSSDPVFDTAFWKSFLDGEPSHWENMGGPARRARAEEIHLRLRAHGWPEVTPSVQTLAELTSLQRLRVFLDDDRHIHPYSVRGTSVCASFFPSFDFARHKGQKNAFDAWHDDILLRRAIRTQLDAGQPTTPARVLKALRWYCHTPSVFRPAVAKYVYQTYAPDGVVWDPCAGFGGRLFGAVAAGVKTYVGTDVEPEMIQGNKLLAECLKFNAVLHEARAEQYDPNMDLDLVFTSPPYYDTEEYGPSAVKYSSVHAWLAQFLRPVMETACKRLKTNGHLVLNVPSRPIQGVRLDSEAMEIARVLKLEVAPSFWMPLRPIGGVVREEPVLVWRKR